jgi:hypothetical protein
MKNFFNIIFIVSIVVLSRFVPHWPNLTAIGASAIWMTYSWPQKNLSILIPILALLVSDFFIGFHDQMFIVYSAVIVSCILIQKIGVEFSPKSLIKNSIISTMVFFLITNFSVWITGNLYAHSTIGLAQCYWAAIPFALNDFIGTLLYGSAGLLVIQKVTLNKTATVRL